VDSKTETTTETTTEVVMEIIVDSTTETETKNLIFWMIIKKTIFWMTLPIKEIDLKEITTTIKTMIEMIEIY